MDIYPFPLFFRAAARGCKPDKARAEIYDKISQSFSRNPFPDVV